MAYYLILPLETVTKGQVRSEVLHLLGGPGELPGLLVGRRLSSPLLPDHPLRRGAAPLRGAAPRGAIPLRAHQLGAPAAPHPAAAAGGLPRAAVPRMVRRHLHPAGLLHGGPHLPGAAGHARQGPVGGPAARRLLGALAPRHGDAPRCPRPLAGLARLG